MRRGVKTLAVLFAFGLFGVVAPVSTEAAPAAGGVTITPATLSLQLAPSAVAQSAEFTITNSYASDITLHFSFETTPGPLGNIPEQSLHVRQSTLVLAPGQTATQLVTFSDDTALGPGSHTANIVIAQQAPSTGGVGVQPSIRVPISLLKQDGAVAELAVSNVAVGGLQFGLPNSAQTVIRNAGNVVSIPRGVVHITGPRGNVVRQGVLNSASLAIAPGGEQTFTTELAALENGLLPGAYRVSVSVGLGGDSPASTTSKTFLFIAWWHIVVLLALAGAIFGLITGRRLWQPAVRKLTRRTA